MVVLIFLTVGYYECEIGMCYCKKILFYPPEVYSILLLNERKIDMYLNKMV